MLVLVVHGRLVVVGGGVVSVGGWVGGGGQLPHKEHPPRVVGHQAELGELAG